MLFLTSKSDIDLGYCPNCPNHAGKSPARSMETKMDELLCPDCVKELKDFLVGTIKKSDIKPLTSLVTLV